jgi:Mn-dependent DtxR family transcriptional regulator
MARIFSTEELMALLDQGLTQKAAAARLGVSPASVSKRMKRLPPPSLTKLTPKERMFVECRAKGVSQTESVCQSYEVSSRQSAKALGHTLSKNHNISTALADLMEHHGVGRSRRVERLAQHIENQDPTVSLKALDTSFKIDGYQTKNDAQELTIKVVDLSRFAMHYDDEKIIVVTPEEISSEEDIETEED